MARLVCARVKTKHLADALGLFLSVGWVASGWVGFGIVRGFGVVLGGLFWLVVSGWVCSGLGGWVVGCSSSVSRSESVSLNCGWWVGIA